MTDKILEENKRRLARIHRRFDPLSGEGSTGERFETVMPGAEDKSPIWLPVSMKGIGLTPATMSICGHSMIFRIGRRNMYI